MAGVFVSYRRSDEAGWARSVYDRLLAAFGPDRVFIDVDGIPPSEDFQDVITQRLRTMDSVVVIIGPQWVTSADEEGRSRLHDPEDLLRREIEIALLLGLRIVPVLVGGAPMPTERELPEELRGLARINALELPAERFDSDVERLVALVGETLPRRRNPTVAAWVAGNPIKASAAAVGPAAR